MINNIVRDNFFTSLDRMENGLLEVATPDGRTRTFAGRKKGVKSRLQIYDWRVISNLARNGDHGLLEDYKSGLWETDNLSGLLTLALSNDNAMRRYIFGSAAFQMLARFSYLLRLNTLKGSRKNIHAHYDLGNDFYALWLDPTMTYSSAIYRHEKESLVQAQYNKYDRILDRLAEKSGSVLEIGCGWGGFAERAVEKSDFSLKGITLSEEQYQYARYRLGDKANIELEDYRHQDGRFDHIVSIEMFEAVGERYWPVYFEKIRSLLKQGGKAVIQTITIDDKRFERYRRGGDVIRSYIFPGGMLPSPSRFRQEAEKAGLRINEEFHFGQDYARTLECWLNRFDCKRSNIKAQGFDDGFIRLWRFYLAACIAGFSTGRTSVMQVEVQHA